MIRRAKKGDRISSSIVTAAAWNLMADAAEAHAAGKSSSIAGGALSGPQVVTVRNNADRTLGRFEVVELLNPVFQVGKGDAGFYKMDAFDVNTPEDPEVPTSIAIVQQPIQMDKLGLAVVFGVSPVSMIDVRDESHQFARAGANGELVSAEAGPCWILWKAPESEEPRTAVVVVTQVPPGETRIFGRITNSSEDGPNRWVYDFEVVSPQSDGSWEVVLDDEDAPVTSATLGPARNTLEASNASDGIQGNGVDTQNLQGTGFELVPIGEGAVVELRGPLAADSDEGEPGFWAFQASNLVDGTCTQGG